MLASPSASAQSEPDPTLGYDYAEIGTARQLATSGAQRALSTSLSAMYANPANVAAGELYHVGAFAQIWPEADRQTYGVGAIDSLLSSSDLAGGVVATYNLQDSDGLDREWTDVRAVLAYPFSESFSLGLGGRYLTLSQGGVGPLGASFASSGLPGEPIVRELSVDAGATYRPSETFAIALVGTNLSEPGHGFLPTTLGAGIGYGQRQLGVEADLVLDFTTWDRTELRTMVGVEALVGEHLGLRAGYRYDGGAEGHAASAGIAYIHRELVLDLAVRRLFSPDTLTTIVLGFTYHLEATALTPSPGDTF
ncbi:MAG TPA: hypothetical protein VKY73_24420 [Polyangiaceae bacterium]|nr:hypothetical protein [Polyangiaceae bacterium]